MPASATPPSLALKNLIWVAFGLPSMIVHATIVPLRGAVSGLCVVPTFTWKPVVRLTARHGLPGQLGDGCRAGRSGITPTSVSVAGEPAGSTSASTRLARIAVDMRLMCAIQHDNRARCSGRTTSLRTRELLRGGGDLLRISRRGDPWQPQRIAVVARNDVDVEVKDRLPGRRAAGVDQVHAVGSAGAPSHGEASRWQAASHRLQVLRIDAQQVGACARAG